MESREKQYNITTICTELKIKAFSLNKNKTLKKSKKVTCLQNIKSNKAIL